MRTRSLNVGVLAGLCAGVLAAVVMSFLDWRRNPSGLFHDEHGTNWPIVAETAFSWFWPVALFVFVAACAAHYLLTRFGFKKTARDE